MLTKTDHLKCPISKTIMDDPVFAADGYTYERQEIQHWLNDMDISPLTNEPLTNTTLQQNNSLKKEIAEYLEAHPEVRFSEQFYLSRALRDQFVGALLVGDTDKLDKCLLDDKRLISISLKPGEDDTALHLAITSEQPQRVIQWVLQALKVHYPDEFKGLVNKGNKQGSTPLHLAIMRNQLLMPYLLEAGASWKIVDNAGVTPEDLARNRKGHKSESTHGLAHHMLSLEHTTEQIDALKEGTDNDDTSSVGAATLDIQSRQNQIFKEILLELAGLKLGVSNLAGKASDLENKVERVAIETEPARKFFANNRIAKLGILQTDNNQTTFVDLSSPKADNAKLQSVVGFVKMGQRRVASPRVASPKVASPKVASPKVASPKVASPKVASPKAKPKAPQPK